MTTLLTAAEAARRLGVQPATLYAYVSRGRVQRVRGVDGRRSFFADDEIDELAHQARRVEPSRASLVPVHIDTSITELGESTLRFRGHDATELATACSFEQVAELLWTGKLRDVVGRWSPTAAVHAEALRAAESVGGSNFTRLSVGLLATGRVIDGAEPLASARILLAAAPSALGAPSSGPFARRVAQIWFPQPDRRLVDAVRRVLVLLADHELASCTLAARIAASTRTGLAGCLVAGLSALSGPLHGGAARAVHQLMVDAEHSDAASLIAGYRQRHEPVPGFGHKVYKSGDPRFAPILQAAKALDADPVRVDLVDSVLRETAARLPVAPNVDLALGVLSYLGNLPSDAPAVMFSIARLAGIVAHVLEEYEAAPVRYRTTARFTGVAPDE
jgi:citrate synthase